MSALLEALVAQPRLSLGVATSYPGVPDLEFEEGGVRYFVHGQPRFQSPFGHQRQDLERSCSFVERFRPDLIHVHGSERFFGLLGARRLVSQPVIVSMQGILAACLPRFFGAMSCVDVVRSLRLREIATLRGLAWEYVQYLRGAQQEEEILRGSTAFLGRTLWDYAQLRRVNPAARYFHVDEALRSEFGAAQWSLQRCRRHSILFTNAGNPRRGVETLLDALPCLLLRWPDVHVRLAGAVSDRSGYGRFLRRRILRSGLRDRVQLLGFLSADELARELSTVHAFVIASFVENSPNSLCEAMRVGTPCVGSYAGGIPTLLVDGESGLMFPPGDSPVLARQVDRVFADDSLATRLGATARKTAGRRHDLTTITSQLLDAYQTVVGRDQHARGEAT